MAKFADQLSTKKTKVCIYAEWFERWKQYLYEKCEDPYESENFKRPGSIDNRKGL